MATVVPGSPSCSISPNSIKTSSRNPLITNKHQKTTFHGVSLADAKGSLSLQELRKSGDRGYQNGQRGLQVMARTAGASRTIEVDVDKPLGLTLGQKSGGGVVITAKDGGGNTAIAGLKAGDQVLYTSSFFGDELWPADKLGGSPKLPSKLSPLAEIISHSPFHTLPT